MFSAAMQVFVDSYRIRVHPHVHMQQTLTECATGARRTAETALTNSNVVTRAVFHAPMFALTADAK
jgi:hypothetical protein